MKYPKFIVGFAFLLSLLLVLPSCARLGFEYAGPYQNSEENLCGTDVHSPIPGAADSDGDGVCDQMDRCYGDDATTDTDNDGICNDRDADDDEDGWSDTDEIACGTDPELSGSVPGDQDGDLVCDPLDLCLGDNATGDTDGDGICNDLDTNDNSDECDLDIDCDDNVPCTVDQCQSGDCIYTPINCAHLDGECVEGVCDSVSGGCRIMNKPDNTVCSDGFFCTLDNICLDGVCVGYDRDCADNDPCTLDICDEETDSCIHPPGGSGITEALAESDTCFNGVDDDCDGLTDELDPTCNDDWWNHDYLARKKLVFANGAQNEDLIDFPVLVVLDNTRIDYSKTLARGQDVRFVDPQNLLSLPFEIEQWDEMGSSLIWVNVPRIDRASNQDFIWMYFNNPDATDGQSIDATWNDDYQAVYHLSDLSDSSGSAFHATNVGAISTVGSFAGGYGAQGDNGYVDLGSNRPFLRNVSSFTFSTWLRTSSASDQALVSVSVFNGDNQTNKSRALLHSNPDFTIKFGARAADSQNLAFCISSGTSLEQDSWHYVVGVVRYDLGTLELYIDGDIDAFETRQFSMPNTPDTVSTRSILGMEEDISTCPLDGQLDEVRIQTTARSANWIKAQYLSMIDSFITYLDQ